MTKIYYDSKFARFLLPKRFSGITLFGRIFFKEKEVFVTKTMVNHELIHVEQQKESVILGVLFSILLLGIFNSFIITMLAFLSFYYLVYLFEYIFLLFKFKFDKQKAYKKISFEQEAYANQDDINYIKNERKHFAWIHYFGC